MADITEYGKKCLIKWTGGQQACAGPASQLAGLHRKAAKPVDVDLAAYGKI